ncbi:MAG: hypothetical protein IH987_17070 [Planctomycetes bacterium]|nr:hypothetical protein [Planctomycetota bacterium]
MACMSQPLTAKQIARMTRIAFDACRDTVRDLAGRGCLVCLNPGARRSRLYWTTPLGDACRSRFCKAAAGQPQGHPVPQVDWNLYGSVCFSHRSVVIMTLAEPMQSAAVKRKARARDPTLRMSANNVRGVMQFLAAHGVVRPVRLGKKAHVRYELTDTGREIQKLLWRAEVFA